MRGPEGWVRRVLTEALPPDAVRSLTAPCVCPP